MADFVKIDEKTAEESVVIKNKINIDHIKEQIASLENQRAEATERYNNEIASIDATLEVLQGKVVALDNLGIR